MGFEAANAIDGDNGTGWQPGAEPAEIVFRVRDYVKNIEAIKLWIPNNTLRTYLSGLTVKAAQNLSQIDEPSNVMVDNVTLTHQPGQALQTVAFASKKRARYVKLEITGSAHAQNEIEIRTFLARVVTTQHSE